MKILLIMSLFTVSCALFAEEDAKFAEMKKEHVDNMTAQIASMTTAKSCLEAAADDAALKKCHDTAKAERKKFEVKKIDKHIEHLQKKKKDIEEKK